MPKWLKILLWIVGGLMALLIALLLSLNTIVRNVLIEKVDNAIANADSIYISYESLDLNVFTGEIRIKGVAFQTDNLETDSLRAFSRMEIDDVWLTGVNYKSLFIDKEIDLIGLIINGVTYRGILDTKAMQANDAANAITEEEREQFEALLREAQKYLKRVTLENLSVRNVKADVRALETGLDLQVANMGVELYGLGYSLIDSIPFYINDSVYDISVNNFTMMMPDSLMNLQVGRLYTVQESRSLVVENIHYASDTVWRTDCNFHDVKVDTIRLDTIVIPDMRTQRSLSFRDLRIVNASYFGCINETPQQKNKKPVEEIDFSKLKIKTSEAQFLAQLQKSQEAMMNDQQRRMLEMVQMWLDEVKLGCLSLENASLDINSYTSDFKINSKNINIAFHDLGYSLIDEIPYHFSDKRYLLNIGPTEITLPDGLMKITCNGFSHANCGPISIGKTRVWTTVDKWRLAHIRGDISSTWVDITMDTFYTSSISPLMTARRRKLALDNVTVGMGDVHIFSDNRNLTLPKFQLPSKQTIIEIMQLFAIRNVNLSMRYMDTEITGHYSGSGHIMLKNALVSLTGIEFRRIEADDIHVTFPDSPMRLDIGGIHTNHSTRNVVVNNASFSTDEQVVPGEQFHRVFVDSIVVEGVMLPEFGNTKDIKASCLRIVHPQYTGYVDEHPDQSKLVKEEDFEVYENEIAYRLKEFNEIQQRNTLRFLQQWLDDASLKKINIDNGDIDIHSVRTGFSLHTNGFSLHTSGVGFSIDKFIPINFSDSVVDFDPIKNNFKMMGSSAIYYLALRNLHTTLPDSSMFLNVKRVTTDTDERSLIISGVVFATDTIVPKGENYHHATIDTIRLDGIILPDFDDQKEASASKLRIINGHYQGIIGGATPKVDTLSTDSLAADTLDAQAIAKQERALAIVQNWFDGASLDAISVENVSADLTDLSSNLDLKEDGLSLSLNDISYSIDRPTSFVFNQKKYSIGVDRVRCLIPDSSLYIEAHNLRHANCGPISLGRTSMHNTVDKWQIAHTKGDVPTTWFSMVLDTFRTSPIDPIRVVSSSFKLRLDSIVAVIDSMYVFRDMRYKPKVPYQMPQPPILAMPEDIVSRFSIKATDAAVNKLILEFPSTKESVPHLEIDSIHGVVSDLDLREGKDICVDAEALFGGGLAHLNAKITLKPECPWGVNLQARDINVNHMDSMLYPMVGLTLGGKVTDLRAIYSGDSAEAKGYVLMAYDSLSAVFHKGSPTPYKFLRDNTKFLTWAARAFLPKNNPSKPGRKPRAYKAKWKNDVWQPSATFMLGPLIKGVIETVLPGIYFSQRVSLDKMIIKHELK